MAAKELKAPEKAEKVEALVEVVQLYLKEDQWFSGVKKLTTSKKAMVLLKSLVGLVAGLVGAVSVVEDPTMQGYIAMGVMGLAGLVVSVWMHAQGKADGEGGKETLDKADKNKILAELTTALKEEITKANKKKK